MISRKYTYLIALAKEKHFGRAAAVCNVSPSTLSAAIRDLEAELGVAVVERGQHFTGLTPEGLCVVRYAQRMVASANDLKQELAQSRDALSGRLRLGVIPTALTVVATLTASFSRSHPLVTIEVLSLPTPQILSRLRSFELDGGIVYQESGQSPDLRMTPLWQENHVLITGSTSLFEGRGAVTWEEAAQTPLCLLTPDMQNRKTIDGVFEQLGHHPKPSMETNSIVSILAHVCSGHWVSIVPRCVLELIGVPQGMRVLDLIDPNVSWSVGLVSLARDPEPPMIKSLIAEAKSIDDMFGNP